MSNPSVKTVGIAVFAALLHVTTVLVLVRQYDYPMTEAFLPLLAVSVGAFGYAFVPTLVSVHTRLVTPVLGLVASVVAVVVATATSPAPVWGTLGSQSVVIGPVYVWNYVTAWPILLALTFVAGVTEFAIRHGYQLASGRLQALPSLPFSRWMLAVTVIPVAGLLGTATALTTSSAGSMVGLLIVGSLVAVATIIPLVALLSRGLVVPIALFAVFVPPVLLAGMFGTPDSGVHLLLLGPYAILFCVGWLFESLLRSRYRGWNGGRFAAKPNLS